jgi:hypothetical protein
MLRQLTGNSKHSPARIAWVGAVLLGWAPFVAAESNPYYLLLSQGVTQDSNVRRAENGSALVSSDTIATTTLAAGLRQMIGRQTISADLRTQFNRHARSASLDSTEYDARSQLDWETIARLSGTARIEASSSLYRLDQGTVAYADKVLVDNRQAALQWKLGSDNPFNVEGGFSFDDNRYSVLALQTSNRRQLTSQIGLRYTPRIQFTSAVSLRHTPGTYGKAGATQVYDFVRDDLNLSVGWVPSTLSQLSAELAMTRLHYVDIGRRNTEGLTGSFRYVRKISGKTDVTFNLRRESNAGSESQSTLGLLGSSLVSVNSATNDNLRTDSASVSVQHSLTGKILLSAAVELQQRQLDNSNQLALDTGTPLSSFQVTGHDHSTTLSLAASYAFSRSIQFNCGVNFYQRTVAGNSAGLSYPLRFDTLSCSGGLTLN